MWARCMPLETGNVRNWRQLLNSDSQGVFGFIFCLNGYRQDSWSIVRGMLRVSGVGL